jgi:hypothetical protein
MNKENFPSIVKEETIMLGCTTPSKVFSNGMVEDIFKILFLVYVY